jgi:hypothetical protein
MTIDKLLLLGTGVLTTYLLYKIGLELWCITYGLF